MASKGIFFIAQSKWIKVLHLEQINFSFVLSSSQYGHEEFSH
jgi:hypothetical protein